MSPPERTPTVEFTTDHPFKCGAEVNDLRPPEADPNDSRHSFCVDGSACECSATRIITVVDVSIASCGMHDHDAREKAADLAGVDLAERATEERGRRGRPADPMNRSPDDYDVSDHPAAN